MKGARYAIVKVDLEQPLRAIPVPEGASGIALELFRGLRPVGFLMRPVRAQRVEVEELSKWIDDAHPPAEIQEPPEIPAQMQRPSVTVAICTRNNPALLSRCLAGLANLEDRPLEFEILVVDNDSCDHSVRDVAEAQPLVRYCREAKAGLNFARNRALSEARDGILAFIDDDVVVDTGWLRGLELAWRRDPGAAAFTGQVLPYEIDTVAQEIVERMGGFRKDFQPIVFGPKDPTDPLYPCTTVFGNGCNMAFRVDTMQALGGFDEALDMGAYLPGGGDLDALYRVVRHGYTLVYEPRMLVRHQHRREVAALRRQVRRSWGSGTMAFLTKIRDEDPVMRAKADAFIRWWLRDLSRQLLRRRVDPARPWSLVLQEAIGALQGLRGLYRRAQERAHRIRQGTMHG